MEEKTQGTGSNFAEVEGQDSLGSKPQGEENSQRLSSLPVDDVSNFGLEPETADDEFQVVQRRKGKSKALSFILQSPIITRNTSKAKAAQRGNDVTKSSFKGGGGASQSSSSGDT